MEDIRKTTTPAQWRFCSVRENPADLVSHGTTAQQLLPSQMWWHGPRWLQQELEQSEQTSLEDPRDVQNEAQTTLVNSVSTINVGHAYF